MSLYMCIATLLACGRENAENAEKGEPTPGACMFESAAAEAYEGIPPD